MRGRARVFCLLFIGRTPHRPVLLQHRQRTRRFPFLPVFALLRTTAADSAPLLLASASSSCSSTARSPTSRSHTNRSCSSASGRACGLPFHKGGYPFTSLLFSSFFFLSSFLREPFANPGSEPCAALPPPRSLSSLFAAPLPPLFHFVPRPRVPCRPALARFPAHQPPRRYDVFIRRSSRRYRYSSCCTPCCSARRSSLRLLPSPLIPADPDFFTTHAADEPSTLHTTPDGCADYTLTRRPVDPTCSLSLPALLPSHPSPCHRRLSSRRSAADSLLRFDPPPINSAS